MTRSGEDPASPLPIEKVEAGLDWLSWVEPDGKTRGMAEALGRQMVEEQRQLGAKLRPFSMEGYQGEQCGAAAWGSRKESDYLRISGPLSQRGLTRLARSCGHPTRLDVQTSLWLTHSRRTLGTHITESPAPHQAIRSGRPSKRTTLTGSDGSYSGMVGARTSPKYIRVYDKGMEQGTHAPGRWWRMEVEAKGYLARGLWSEVKKERDVSGWSLLCCERVLKSAGCCWPLTDSSALPPLPPVEPDEPKEVAAVLSWLMRNVRPSVERLIPFVGVERLVRALGLDAYVEVIPPNLG